MYVCMYVHEDWMQEAEDDAKRLPDTRDFYSLIKRIPVTELSWKSVNMEWDIQQNVQFWS